MDAIQAFVFWFAPWLLVLMIASTIQLLISKLFNYNEKVMGITLLIFYVPILFASLLDLVFRIKGKQNLFIRIYHLKAFKKSCEIIEKIFKLFGVVFTAFISILILCLIGIIIYMILSGISTIPVSTAIIIGALIIASAISKSRAS